MRRILILVLFFSQFCHAQNYQCLQAGVVRYFTNSQGYLRGIRIDSVRTWGDTIVYYSFHTPRGAYDPNPGITFPVLDTNGGSWVGNKVFQLNDGTFIFDSYWGGSLTVKSQANVGDSWVMYRDASHLYYKDSVIGLDTMTVLSTLDTVKKIVINAFNDSGLVASDPMNGTVMYLSKNHGFVRAVDLYTFPYHKADSTYRPGLDFFLDRSLCDYSTVRGHIPWGAVPDSSNAVFELVDFMNPNEQQLHNWHLGDIFMTSHRYGAIIWYGADCTETITDSVVSAVTAGHIATYLLGGDAGSYLCGSNYFYCHFITSAGTYNFSDLIYPIVPGSYFPETYPYSNRYLFYSAKDTGKCIVSPAYTTVPFDFYSGLGEILSVKTYKLGLGLVDYNYGDGEPSFDMSTLKSYKSGAVSCGMPSAVPVVNKTTFGISLFPNPVSDELTIMGSGKMTSVSICNLLGSVVFMQQCSSEKVVIDVSNLMAGVYFVRVNGVVVRRFVKE